MQKAEFQIILELLRDKNAVKMSYRQIADITGTSVGSVHNTLQHLVERGYVVVDVGERLLRKRSELLDRWSRAYADGLKERYFITRFTFLSALARQSWQAVRLPSTACWGGEPGAALADNYLKPEQWDIYTSDSTNALIATGRMIPKPDGEIAVYRKFWQGEGVPLQIIYADLIAADDDRCLEAAARLKPMM